jgi:hypothetical protein
MGIPLLAVWRFFADGDAEINVQEENPMSRTTTGIVLAVVSIFLLACGGTGAPTSTPAPPPTDRPLMSFDFEPVCRRGTVKKATAYEPMPGRVHPILVFKRDRLEDNSYYEVPPTTLKLPVPWMVDYGSDYTKVELVACLTRTGGDFVSTCDYKDDDSEETFLLNVYNSTYEVKIYAARSGKEIGTATVEAIVDDCPMLYIFSEKEEDYFAWPASGTLESALRPYVEP